MSLQLTLQNASSYKNIPTKKEFSKWIKDALDTSRSDAELTLRIVDEEESRELNHEWRKKDKATNVLSFPVGEIIEQMPNLLGDLVICAPLVKKEADEQQKDIKAHWAHLTIHGTLHLQGYDHIQDADAEKMEAKEITILAKLGFENPYIEKQVNSA